MKILTSLILFVLASLSLAPASASQTGSNTAQEEPIVVTIEFLAQTFALANTASSYCIAKFDYGVPILPIAILTLERSQEIRRMFDQISPFEIPTKIKFQVDKDVKRWSKGYLEVLVVGHEIESQICNKKTFVAINRRLNILYRSMLRSA